MTVMPIGWINENTGKGWTDREEGVIAKLMGTESLNRMEAIRAMRIRKLDDLQGGIRQLTTSLTDCV
jgi:hypothetical protein